MLNISDISVQTQIYESANSLVYRGIRESDNQPIILKILKENYPTPQELARYRTEYEITKSLNLTGVVKVYDLQKYQNTLVMFLEDFGGESLRVWMQQRSFTLEEFLKIAIAITETLGQIHAANIIHKDINPSNIVYNPATGQLKIIDFGISTKLTRENPTIKNPNVLEGTLAYMSPEQTGRMNRSLDYRTDFYSLGITFYELLTGKLPFETIDALELVHCHIAKQPLPPHLVGAKHSGDRLSGNRTDLFPNASPFPSDRLSGNPTDLFPNASSFPSEIPQIIADIVMKLMAKTAEDRYQSAFGIKADLEECLYQLEQNGIISHFSIAQQDISDKFQLPQKLYGREREIETLLTAFERVTSQSEMILIGGYSGIGKTALVQELYKPITEKRGYFISGKFDQYQRNIPYSAIAAAFRELIKQLLSETETKLNQWREKLQAALGNNGQVIIEAIPEVELIIGKQPAVPEVGPNESQNRFNLVFQNFIKVFTKTEHPLAIFIDDLQWADGASLKLIQLLMSGASTGLFLISAYRDNEVSSVHPLMLTVEEIAKTGAKIEQVALSPLQLRTVTQIVADTLKCSESRAKHLAELVVVKTGGNPFFLNEFLKSLYTEGLLEFDLTARCWQWNLPEIQGRGFTDNVVELMAGKIERLPETTQEILKLAACIGNQFDLETLGLIAEKSLKEAASNLLSAVAESLVVPLGNMGDVELAIAAREFASPQLSTALSQAVEYKFVHDRIQQAAYSLIPDNNRKIVHRQIGQVLLKNTSSKNREEKIFDIVNQLNFCLSLITEQSERDELAGLNLIAGKKAKLSAAYQPALNYLQVGIELLATDSWQQQYHLTLSLYEETAEVAYLNANFDLMEGFIKLVLAEAKTVLDKVKVYEVKILAYMAQGNFLSAIDFVLEILKLLGVRLPKNPSQLDILWGLLQVKTSLGFRPIASLINLPVMSNPYPKAAMRILAAIAASGYLSVPMLYLLMVFKMVNLSIKWGNAAESTFAYSCYGQILCNILKDIDNGAQFGQLALNLQVALNVTGIKARVMIYFFIKHWIEPVKAILNPLREMYVDGVETGELEYACWAATIYCWVAFLNGCELKQMESEMSIYSLVFWEKGQKTISEYHSIYHQTALNLLGQAENSCDLIGNVFDEQAMTPRFQSRNDYLSLFTMYFSKLILCFLFGEATLAVNNAKEARHYRDSMRGSTLILDFYFYESLACLSAINSKDSVSEVTRNFPRKQLLHKVRQNQKELRKCAHYAPMNYLQKYLLVEAELYRVQGKDSLATDYYDKAIAKAKENDYVHEVAIAYELAAKFYLSRGKELIAKAYMQEARYHYQLWGATAKVKHLEKQYSKLLGATQAQIKDIKTSTGATTTGSSNNLDIATVMKASQAISGEIVLDKLLSSLMKILIENAGAQTGYLILSERGKLLIEASGTIDEEQVKVLRSIPVSQCQTISETIVNYVARTKETVVLNDATREGKFTNDSYIKERQPKSILCLPLINQGRLISIVYLENNRTIGAFAPERQEVLNLLSSQAAISIENAQLYNNMTKLNRAYERFVPSQFLQFLDKSSIVDVQLGDQVQLEMSVLFSDIRDFTTLSESMTPEENFKFINSYLSRMEPVITENHGFIDKYIGDAIMALFSGEADNAVKAGIAMLNQLPQYNQYRANCGYVPIQIGIGINTGSLMLGTVGGQNRMDGTVISDAVNLASRVEGLTKNYGVSLLITEQTYSRLTNPAKYGIRTIDTVKVKGKSQRVTVYEVFDADLPEIKEGKLTTLSLFAEALSLYGEGKFAEAGRLFADCWQQNPGDRVAKIYLERCQNN
ncbi:AAA family ATPase [Aerosakkonema sp. BLCC-F183]|uniref:AAA family ATPase n=1 Tax=Aerosakkonema sp. BLCC-F183 TaxID=3342834 RepID=UPI0035B7F82A